MQTIIIIYKCLVCYVQLSVNCSTQVMKSNIERKAYMCGLQNSLVRYANLQWSVVLTSAVFSKTLYYK